MRSAFKLAALIMYLTSIFVICFPGLHARNYPGFPPAEPVLLTGQLEVQFETDVDVSSLKQSVPGKKLGIASIDKVLENIQLIKASPLFPWRRGDDAIAGSSNMEKMFILELPVSTDIFDVIDELQKNPYVRSVGLVWAMPLDISPNDPAIGGQWGIHKIDNTSAWDIERGSEDAIIAIADAGVLYDHPDLHDNIWVNPGEDIDGDEVVMDLGDANSVDDDGNLIVDDLIGYDFFTGFSGLTAWEGEDANTPDIDPNDFNGHGTHVAGIAAMISNNSDYGAGVAGGWGGGNGPYRGARIMCLRVGGSAEHPDYGYEAGYVNTANCAQAIDYAASNGACVINCSWGSSNAGGMEAALQKANDNGMVVVHSAGNGSNYSVEGGYMDNLFLGGYQVALSVAATASNDAKAGFSTYGPFVDVSAPGDNIYATYSDHYGVDDAVLDGTSMSSPFVSGLAALIKSHMPHYTKYEIDPLIVDNADDIYDINPGYVGDLGSGRINAYASLAGLPVASFEAGPVLVGPAPLEVTFTDLSPSATSWSWDFGDDGTSTDQNPVHVYEDPGLFDVSLAVDEPRGAVTEILRRLVMPTADTMRIESMAIPFQIANHHVALPVYLSNRFQSKEIHLPIKILKDGSPLAPFTDELGIDSVSIVGTRTDHFEFKSIAPMDRFNQEFGFNLASNFGEGSEYLFPGQGTVMNIYMTIEGGYPVGTVYTFDATEASGVILELVSIYADYMPVFVLGEITVENLWLCGDVDGDEFYDILDIVFMIDFKFKDGAAPEPETRADVNLDGDVNILDITHMIDNKFKEGPEPCE
jgi:subtilisin family serine protease